MVSHNRAKIGMQSGDAFNLAKTLSLEENIILQQIKSVASENLKSLSIISQTSNIAVFMAMFLYSLNIFEVVLHKVDKRLSLRRKLLARFRLQALPSYWKDDYRRHHSVT